MKRYYVTATWHDWPEGGSYGTVIETSIEDLGKAVTYAELMCRESMADTIAEEFKPDEPESDPAYWLENYADQWHIVDCFDLDEFITDHSGG